MQGELQKQKDFKYDERTRSSLLWKEISGLLNQYTGLGPACGVTTLAEMLSSLRIASEAILGAPLPATVVFTAPWMHAWSYEETLTDGLVEKARILAGLRPVMVENMDSNYLSETNTVLAANGRQICPDLRCNGPEFSDEPPSTNEVVYFLSFTNHSLYTSFQLATCFFLSSTTNRLGTINPEFGLNQQEHTSDEKTFWYNLQDYLVSQAREYVISGDYSLRQHCIVLIAGEAADNPKFLDTVRQAITRIQNDPIHRSQEAGTGPKIELLVSQELTFAAATGAALWRRTMIDSSYCEDKEANNGKRRP
ncbi:hypothetical protein V8C42DRAFT_336777 [Trichoderma barbatum]